MGGGVNHKTFTIDAMPYQEAFIFFQQITKISTDADGDQLFKIAEEIVRRCVGLPLAVKTIAKALRDQNKEKWSSALLNLENFVLDDEVSRILQVSFDFLESNELKAIFLLCCLFPEDHDIPIEDVTRFCVGLRLFLKFGSGGDCVKTRIKAHACVAKLKSTNLLIGSDEADCVKVHDVMRAFGLGVASKGRHALLIEHCSLDIYEPFTGISLSCTDMLEFPEERNSPNLTLLNLIDLHLRQKHDDVSKLYVYLSHFHSFYVLFVTIFVSYSLRLTTRAHF